MTLWLKQSTAKVVSFGPFLDKTDGVTEETGLVSALDHASTGIKLSKNGGALTIRHASVTATTYDAYGAYLVTLDTTDTNTLGTLRMAFNEAATCLPVWQDFMVLPANIFDSLVSGSDLVDVSMTQILGTAVASPATAGVLDVNLKNIANAAVSTSTAQLGVNAVQAGGTAWGSGAITAASIADNAIDAGSIASGAITAAKFAAGAIDAAAIANGAIDNATFAADVGSTALATNIIAKAAEKAIGVAGLSLTAIPTIATVTTVTNLTNAPTNGDLTATMKTSVTTAATAATPIAASVAGNVGGNVVGSVGSVVGAVGSVTGLTAAHLDVAVSSRLATVGYTAPLDAAGTRTAVGLATANLDTQLAALPTDAENATALLDATNGVETGLTPREALRLTTAALAGKISGAETTTVVIRNTADTKDRITATVDADGNRTAITTDLT